MVDGSAHIARSRSKLIGSGVGLVGMVGLFLLMSREGQLPHATTLGVVLLGGSIFGLLAALGLLAPETDATPLRQTSFFALDGESPWTAPNRTAPAAIVVLALLWIWLGGH